MSNETPIRRSLLDMGIARFAGPAPVQEWAVKGPEAEGGLLPAAAPILIVGQGGVGKTRAAIELALKGAAWDGIDTAPTWMGQEISNVGVSVVLSYEESTDSMHRAIQKMADAAGIDPTVVDKRMLVKSYQDVDVVPMPLVGNDPQTRSPVPTPEYKALTEELRQIRAQVGEIGCIVVDNVGTAFAVEGNDYQSANQAMKWIQRWAAEFGALVIVIAHTNKGALKFESDSPSVNELLGATMGSTGWVSAVRLAMVMWTISEEGEAQIAKDLDDPDFKPGVTKNRYIRARVVKENIEGAYMGTFTLRRAGGTLEDVSKTTNGAKTEAMESQIAEFAAAIGRNWTLQTPLQKSGTRGVFLHRGALGKPFATASKTALATLTDRALASGALRLEPVAPGATGTRGMWLFDCSGRGRREAWLEALHKARRAASRAKIAFKASNVEEWRALNTMGLLSTVSAADVAAAIEELEANRLLSITDGFIIPHAIA